MNSSHDTSAPGERMFRPDCYGLLQLQDNVSYPPSRALYIQFPLPVGKVALEEDEEICTCFQRSPANEFRQVRS